MAFHDSLPRTQFGTVMFPGRVNRLRVGGRYFEHEYPHVAKGAPEKLGAKLRHCIIEGSFDSRMAAYPGLYPAGMLQMLAWAESQSTQTLVHRSAGTFPAFIVNYDQTLDARIRSGEKVELEFCEDTPADFTTQQITPVSSSASLAPTAAQMALDLASIRSQLQPTANDLSLFDALQEAVAEVVGVQDTKTLYGNLYAAKIDTVISLCQQLHDATPSLQDVRAWPVVSDIITLQSLAIDVKNDLASQNVRLATYRVPFTQPIAQIAVTLYQDSSRQSDLLALNSNVIGNAMAVQAGTPIRYYPPGS